MTTTPPQRIGGWLLGPLAWLLVALLSASLALLLYVMALATPQTFKTLSGQETGNLLLWGISFITAIAMWYYTLWLTIAFFKRRRCVPKHYIIWLLVSVLLAVIVQTIVLRHDAGMFTVKGINRLKILQDAIDRNLHPGQAAEMLGITP
ncbi:DUF2569 domain-containing protein, partial [Salmonella enterica]|uniref:DUF2569 domain-containing protein n=1 Tax=Salmonella enterica TaxID=28901 RepID=UPI001D0CAFAA